MDINLFIQALNHINKALKVIFSLLSSVKAHELSSNQVYLLTRCIDDNVDKLLDFKKEVCTREKKKDDK